MIEIQSLSDWRKNKPKEYRYAKDNNMLNSICEIKGWKLNKPSGYWDSKENCINEALKYSKKSEWKIKSFASHKSAVKNGWFDECVSHMESFFWTYEECKIEAEKYTHIKSWRENSLKTYNSAKTNGWFEELSKHMIRGAIPHSYWTLELCKEDALKYNTKTEWVKASNSAYKTSLENDWYDECVAHMTVFFTKSEHWTKERCIESSKKFKTKKEWKYGCSGSYRVARKNKWVDELSAHMEEYLKPKGYWTLELCKKEALAFDMKEHWKKGHPASYQAARTRKLVDECCEHMIEGCKPSGYWNKERCVEHAKQFTTVSEWLKANSTPSTNARVNGWYDECTAHMIRVSKPNNYWNDKKKCIEEALKYNTSGEWSKNSSASYSSSRRNGWLDECTTHMLKTRENRKPSGYWTKERCIEESLKHDTKSEWLKNSAGSLNRAKLNGWYDECTKHMKK